MSSTQHSSAPGGTGPGAGIGEAFNVNLSTGTATHAYSLMLPDGVAGHGPRLALEYAHHAPLGPFGLGWSLAVRSIDAALDHGTPDEARALRYLDGGAEIAPTADGTYRAVRESAFARYRRAGDGWTIEERNGVVHVLGDAADTRLADPDRPDRVLRWLLASSTDTSGNRVDYTYRHDDGHAYLAAVRWARYEVRFEHAARPDVRHDGRMGFARRLALRCARAVLVLDPGPTERVIRSWTFTYELAPGSAVSLLTGIDLRAHGTAPDGSLDVARPRVTFAYSPFDLGAFHPSLMTADGGDPPPLTDPDIALVTLDDAPLPGVLVNRGGRQYYWPNLGGGRFGRARPVADTPMVSGFGRAGLAFVDLDGSGTSDLMVADPDAAQGFYRNAGAGGWDRFVAFRRGSATPQWSDRTTRLLDADADGLVDAVAATRGGLRWWRNVGDAGWADPVLALSPGLTGVDFAADDVHLADMTGDGVVDVVRVRSGKVEYWPGLGNGRFGARVVMQHSPRLSRRAPWSTVVLVDLDGDGCADLVCLDTDGVTVALNQNGTSFTEARTLALGLPPTPGTVRAINMDGAPTAALLWTTPSSRGSRYVRWHAPRSTPAYLLTTVDNGAGLVSTLTYRSAVDDLARDRAAGRAAAWTTNFPFPYVVVAAAYERDAVSGRETEIEYRYHEAHFEAATRQFQGFRTTERITRGDASRPDGLEVHHFAMAQERVPGNTAEHALLNGVLERIETYALDGSPLADRPLRVETCRHGLTVLDTLADGRHRVFVHVTEHRRDDTERTDDVRTETTSYAYDEHGNVVREERRGSGRRDGMAVAELALVNETEYASSATRHLVDKPCRVTVRDSAGTLLDEHRTYYDGPDFVGLPLGQVDRGLVAREEELVADEAMFAAHHAGMDAAALGFHEATDADGAAGVFAHPRRARYDARGLAVGTLDPLGIATTLTHDAAGLFRIGLDDAYGHSTFEYDEATGQITATTLADGTTTRFRYDAQGRVVSSALPGQDLDDPAAAYSYDETAVPHRRTTRLRLEDGTDSLNVTYFDGSGKEIQQRVTVSPGTFLVSGTFARNPWGDPVAEQEPTFADSLDFSIPAAAAMRRFEYDGLGRVVRSVNCNGGVSTAHFEPFAVTTLDANANDDSPENVARGRSGIVHREEFDALRRLTRVADSGPAGVLEAVDYVIGAAGELLELRDGGTTRFAYTYDRRGCRLSVTSAEAGVRSVWYDARKKPVRTRDGNGNDLVAGWDAAERLATLTAHDPVGGDRVLERYTYDTPAQHALGRLAAVEYDGGSQRFDYDPAGRLLTRAYRFDGEAVEETLSYEYDPLGRQLAVTHTDGRRVRHHLTANGWLAGIDGVLDQVDYDPRGLPVRMAFANGVESTITYTPGPGRVSHRRTTARSGAVLEDVTSAYDASEQLLATDDVAPGGLGARVYTYDPLGQLTSMSFDDQGVPARRDYTYAGRNLLRNGEAGVDLAYDPLRPDCLASVTGDGQPTFVATHDAGGNLAGLPGMSFTFNAKNELVRLDTDDGIVARYAYDHLGMRISKTVTAAGTTHVSRFLGDQAELRDGVRSVIVTVGGMRLAVLTGDSKRFVHDGPTGTTAFFTDEDGERIGSIDLHPFGGEARRDGDVDFACYSLHPIDAESGLVYMRRRYYSPVIGRFLTPDLMALYRPEAFLHAPAGLHLYAYVANDPTNRTDRDGMSFWSFVGSVVGVVVGVIVGVLIVAAVVATGGIAGVLLGIGLALAASLLVTGVSYIVASNVDPNSGFGQFMRGFMIGFNAGMNGVLAAAIFGPVIGVAVGVINFLATFDGIAKNSVYQGILGWSSWLMPMSWGATGLGVAFYVVNLVVAGVTFQQWDAAKIDKLAIDWRTGSIVMVGGLVRGPTAFNMGNFVFMNPSYVDGSSPDRTYDAVLDHETGHTLAVAAFGTAFGIADLIGENVVGSGSGDYGERIAESHANRPGRPTIPMWS